MASYFHGDLLTQEEEEEEGGGRRNSVKNKATLRFETLTAVTMKFVILWDVTPCSLVEEYQRFQ